MIDPNALFWGLVACWVAFAVITMIVATWIQLQLKKKEKQQLETSQNQSEQLADKSSESPAPTEPARVAHDSASAALPVEGAATDGIVSEGVSVTKATLTGGEPAKVTTTENTAVASATVTPVEDIPAGPNTAATEGDVLEPAATPDPTHARALIAQALSTKEALERITEGANLLPSLVDAYTYINNVGPQIIDRKFKPKEVNSFLNGLQKLADDLSAQTKQLEPLVEEAYQYLQELQIADDDPAPALADKINEVSAKIKSFESAASQCLALIEFGTAALLLKQLLPHSNDGSTKAQINDLVATAAKLMVTVGSVQELIEHKLPSVLLPPSGSDLGTAGATTDRN